MERATQLFELTTITLPQYFQRTNLIFSTEAGDILVIRVFFITRTDDLPQANYWGKRPVIAS